MLSIGTDCSGIEAPVQALLQLGIEFQHKWACDIDKFARQSIQANYTPDVLYEDITSRDHSTLPYVDIYVCGFPCQAFSLLGRRKGSDDPRGLIMYHCIEVIKHVQPKMFILENVIQFKTIENGKLFKILIDSLLDIKDMNGDTIYEIDSSIYNTRDYGIPQNRKRLYMVGVKKGAKRVEKSFIQPEKCEMRQLEDYIIDKTVYKMKIPLTIKTKLEKINYAKDHVTCCDNYTQAKYNAVPALTKSGTKYMYHTTYHRYLRTKECLMLQGFSCDFVNVVGDTQLCYQIGNSMSVCVLKAIFLQLFTLF